MHSLYPTDRANKCVDEEDWIRTNLRMCKNRSIYRNQLQKLNLTSNAHNSTNTTQNWTKLPPKEMKFQELSNNM